MAEQLSISMTVIYTVLSLCGVVGNALVIVVVVKVKQMRTATNCYLVSLAISDSLFFFSALPSEIHSQFYPARYDFGQIGCMLQTFITYLSMNTSSLSVAAFSVERYIGICYPMKAMYSCTVRRAIVIVVSIWLFSILYNSPWLFIATIKHQPLQLVHNASHNTTTTTKKCDFRYDRNSLTYKAIYVGDILVFYVVPMVLYVFLYSRIAKSLRNRVPSMKGSSVRHKTRVSMHLTTANGTTASEVTELDGVSSKRSSTHVLPASPSSPLPNDRQHLRLADVVRRKKRSQQDDHDVQPTKDKHASRQIVKMLAVVTLLFAVLWMPYKGMVLYNSFASQLWAPDWFLLMAKTFVFINAAINPLLYNVMSVKFRTAFLKLLLGHNRYIDRDRDTTTGHHHGAAKAKAVTTAEAGRVRSLKARPIALGEEQSYLLRPDPISRRISTT